MKNKFIILILIFIYVLFDSKYINAIILPNNITNNTWNKTENIPSNYLEELQKCEYVYHQKMKDKFQKDFNIIPPNSNAQETCNYSDTKSFIDMSDLILSLYGVDAKQYVKYIKEANEDCNKFFTKNLIYEKCINSKNDIIPYFEYKYILYAYQACSVNYINYLYGKKSTKKGDSPFIADVLKEKENMNLWIENSVKNAKTTLDIAIQIMAEEKKAVQIIQPICNIIKSLKTASEKIEDIRYKFIEWIPLVTNRQLRDGI